MPKRNIHLTKVKKEGKQRKERLVERIQESLNNYKYLYVLSHENMTTNPFNKIRKDFLESKFFLGKNKVMQFALGRTPEEEFKTNLCGVAKYINKECCLLLTNDDNASEYFENFSKKDYAKAGTIAPKTITLEEGPETLKSFSFAIEPHMRKLGLVTKLVRSKIILCKDTIIAKEGQPITAENAKILKLLGYKLAEFKLRVLARWNSETSEIESFDD
ncbi:unnamed protein product [Moneuplotes crassus]|uniref:Ribosome assembly factor mrt4 n=1 Tax=Euplotes crassus TaxID=5936 RepID=A0AAD2D4M2_EUPCR|nr:unnamed protein product [Moneuplotes crassus]